MQAFPITSPPIACFVHTAGKRHTILVNIFNNTGFFMKNRMPHRRLSRCFITRNGDFNFKKTIFYKPRQ